MSRYDTPRQAITLDWAEANTEKSCMYYDRTSDTLEQWREHLEGSDVSNYTFLSDNIATARYGLSQSIRKYVDGTVLSWSVAEMYEINGAA